MKTINVTQGALAAALALAFAGTSAGAVSLSWDGNGQTQLIADFDQAPPTPQAIPVQRSAARPRGKVLVVLSSESKITLKNGVVHPTGFFLSELMVPLKALIAAGYQPVLADPRGTPAIMDRISDGAAGFGDAPGSAPQIRAQAQRDYQEIRELCRQLGLCGDGLTGTRNLENLPEIVAGGLEQYDAVLVPGGHAPMEDLLKDRNLGTILRSFHGAGKPTALICHGPISLLSALDRPEEFIAALERNDAPAQAASAKDWIYQGYSMTSFTTDEERQEEPGQDDALGGFVKFYPDSALESAGGRLRRAEKWNSNVVVDRELITGQNPMSDEALADALVKALESESR
jgi:putative intracellular protease/amidase